MLGCIASVDKLNVRALKMDMSEFKCRPNSTVRKKAIAARPYAIIICYAQKYVCSHSLNRSDDDDEVDAVRESDD